MKTVDELAICASRLSCRANSGNRVRPRNDPCLPTVARVHSLDEADEAAAREKLGDKFPKHIYHASFVSALSLQSGSRGCGSSEAWEHRTSRSAWRPI